MSDFPNPDSRSYFSLLLFRSIPIRQMLGSTPPGEGRNRTTDHGSKANPADPHLRQDPAFLRCCLIYSSGPYKKLNLKHHFIFVFFIYFFYHSSCRKDHFTVFNLKFGTQDFTDPGLLNIRRTLTGLSLWFCPHKCFLQELFANFLPM